MEDIKVGGFFGRLKYFISWVGFIFGGFFLGGFIPGGFIFIGFIVPWIIASLLVFYGKNTSKNTTADKYLLNKTWEKFAYIYGLIVGIVMILYVFYMFFIVAKVAGLW